MESNLCADNIVRLETVVRYVLFRVRITTTFDDTVLLFRTNKSRCFDNAVLKIWLYGTNRSNPTVPKTWILPTGTYGSAVKLFLYIVFYIKHILYHYLGVKYH